MSPPVSPAERALIGPLVVIDRETDIADGTTIAASSEIRAHV
jgi:UDP-3-O-[3-hydroxymyristoyl] glucosamine N-acyltransferase